MDKAIYVLYCMNDTRCYNDDDDDELRPEGANPKRH